MTAVTIKQAAENLESLVAEGRRGCDHGRGRQSGWAGSLGVGPGEETRFDRERQRTNLDVRRFRRAARRLQRLYVLRLLLDTHAFLWAVNVSPRLSMASPWEVAIKLSIGKLRLDISFLELAVQKTTARGVETMQISPTHLDTPPSPSTIATRSTDSSSPSASPRTFRSPSATTLWTVMEWNVSGEARVSLVSRSRGTRR